MDSVPQNRANVMRADFFRRLRNSFQKKRGSVGFMSLSQGGDRVGRRGGPGRDHPRDDADREQDQYRRDDDQGVQDGHAR